MAKSAARDAEGFARLMFRTVEQMGEEGEWVRARDAFDRTAAGHPDHPYVAWVQAKPARRIGLSAVAERVRAAEFDHIERRKAGNRRNAPVYYRTVRPGVDLELNLPYAPPPSHPLVGGRAPVPVDGASGRRAALMVPAAKSTWRRQLHGRRLPGGEAGQIRRWWAWLRAATEALVEALARWPDRRPG